MTQQKRQYDSRLGNPLLPTSVYVASTAKEEKNELQVRKPTVAKEGSSLHHQIEERLSTEPEILAAHFQGFYNRGNWTTPSMQLLAQQKQQQQ